MRPIRQNTPGRRWFLTSRTLESRFFLLPDKETNEVIGFYLARALRLFPSMKLIAVVCLSNHCHLVVEDGGGQLSAFAAHFFGNVARELNILHERTGTVFPRPYSAEAILDDEALAGRIRYTLLNPAADRLTDTYDLWPGLLGWSLFNKRLEFKRFNRREFGRVLRKAEPGLEPERDDFIETEVLELAELPESLDADQIEREVREEEAKLRAKRQWSLGPKKILAQKFEDKPKHTDRSQRPLCHASTSPAWFEYLRQTRAFRVAYQIASIAFRAGKLLVEFPAHCFRPPTAVRPSLVAT